MSWRERCLRISWPSTGPGVIGVTAQSVTSRLRPSMKDTLDFISSFFFISSCFLFVFFFFSCFSFLFVFPFFPVFSPTFLFFFSVVRADAETGKNRGEVLIVKMTFFFSEETIFGPRMERGKMRNGPFEGDFTLMFFISLFIFSIVCFSYKKCSSFFWFAFQQGFISGITSRD